MTELKQDAFTYTGCDLFAIVSMSHLNKDYIWDKPYGNADASTVSTTDDYLGKEVHLVEMAIRREDSYTWYRAENLGWLHVSVLEYINPVSRNTTTPFTGYASDKIRAITTNKSVYKPGEDIIVTVDADDGVMSATLIDPTTGNMVNGSVGNTSKTATLTAPNIDYRGYLLEVELVTDEGTYTRTSAVDVSSDWLKFPRYAALTNFCPWTQDGKDSVEVNVATMNKFHINATMYYDAYYRPQVPYKDGIFQSWIGEDIDPKLVRKAIDLQHTYGQKALIYNMINATTGSPEDTDANLQDNPLFGVKDKEDGTRMLEARTGIFRTVKEITGKGAGTFDNRGDQQTFNMLGDFACTDPSHKIQSYHNPFSTDWCDFIGKIMHDTLADMGFDGWQGDTIGDQQLVTSYENRGTDNESFNVSMGYGHFADEMKKRLGDGKYFGLNAVGGQGQKYLDMSTADFQYSEIWPNHDMDDNSAPGNVKGHHNTYSDLSRIIDNTERNAGQSLIMPAYLYRDWAKNQATVGKLPEVMNDNVVKLKDSVIMASGGVPMELADNGHQIYTEYYPDGHKEGKIKMSDKLGNPDHGDLRRMYDFITAHQNILRDSMRSTRQTVAVMIDGKDVSSRDGMPNSVMPITRKGNGFETISLINLMGVQNINWQVNNALDESQKDVQSQALFTVKYYTDSPVSSVQVTSPDVAFQGVMKEQDFTTGNDDKGNFIEFLVPSLEIWDLIYVK